MQPPIRPARGVGVLEPAVGDAGELAKLFLQGVRRLLQGAGPGADPGAVLQIHPDHPSPVIDVQTREVEEHLARQ